MTASLGIILGVVASIAFTRGLDAFLYEVQPRDPMVMAVTVAVLLAVTTLAGYFPARRALAQSPAEILRTE